MWVDLRFARQQERLSLRHGLFRDAVVTLAARLHGTSKDELEDEDVRQYRRTWRWVRSTIAALTALVVLAATFAVVAVVQGARAEANLRVAAGRGLLAESTALRERDPRSALLLGLAAYRVNPTPEAREALLTTVVQTHYAGALPAQPHTVRAVAFDPRTGTLATANADSVVLWDGSRRTQVAAVSLPGLVEAVTFSPAGGPARCRD